VVTLSMGIDFLKVILTETSIDRLHDPTVPLPTYEGLGFALRQGCGAAHACLAASALPAARSMEELTSPPIKRAMPVR
jgi:hypothetical protein